MGVRGPQSTFPSPSLPGWGSRGPGAQLSLALGTGLTLLGSGSPHYPERQLPQASSLIQGKMSLAGSGPGLVQVPFASQLLAPPRAVTWLDASYLGPGGTPQPEDLGRSMAA